MDEKLWISLITSIGAIIVSIIGVLGTSYNKKRVLKAEKSLEDFKVSLEREKVKYQIYSEELNHSFSLMGDLIGEIQVFKDFILMIQTSTTKVNIDIMLTTIFELKNNFFIFYQKNSQFVNNDSLDAAHKAKNIINELNKYFIEISNSYDIKDKNISDSIELKSFHSKLSDCQNTLRDGRMEIISFPQ